MALTIRWGMWKRLQEYQVISEKFKNRIHDLTNGQIEILPVLFDEDPENPLEEITSNNIDIYQVSSDHLRLITNIEWLKCWEVPFLFENKEHVEKYIKSKRAKETLKTLENEKLLPLTYSYAGGFMSTVKRKGGDLGDLKENTFVIHEFDIEDVDDVGMSFMYAKLPFTILMYEIDKISQLGKFKNSLEVEITNHMVQARITFISKDTLTLIPEEYREKFLNILEEVLDEERETIYKKSEKNLATVLEDLDLKVKVWNDSEKEEYLKKVIPVGSDRLNEEITYILSLK